MNNYINLSHQPHTLKVTSRKNNNIVFVETFDTEKEALDYLHKSKERLGKNHNFSYVITGPNMYYSI